MYSNLRVVTSKISFTSILKLTTITFSVYLTFCFALVSFIGYGQTFKSRSNNAVSGNSISIAKPINLSVGDLMIAQVARSSDNGVNMTAATSAGWSLVSGNQYRSNSNDRWHVTILQKFATPADIAATNFTFSGNETDAMVGAIMSFSDALNVSVVGNWGTTTDDNSYSAPQITTLSANSMIVMFGAVTDDGRLANDNSWLFNSRAMTERYDIEYDANKDLGIAAATLPLCAITSSAGSATISGDVRNTSLLLAISGNTAITANASVSTICMGNTSNLSSNAAFNNVPFVMFQGFESGNNWGYTQSSGVSLSTSVVRTGTNSLQLRGSDNQNVDPAVTFNNVQLTGFSNVQLSVSFAAVDVDSDDDLWLDLSYNNGASWESTKLIDGNDNFDCSYSSTSSTNPGRVLVGENPYIITVPSTSTQIRVRLRFDERNNRDNTNDYYYVDDVTITGTPNSISYSWTSDPAGFTSSVQNPTVSPNATTTYTVTATNASGCSASASTTIALPTIGTALSNNNDAATCIVNQNGWVHFYHSSGRLIGSINSQGQNLGNVSMTSYVDVTNASVPACANPTEASTMTVVMQRHWVVTPQIQPSSPVLVRWPYAQTEFLTLSALSTSNSNINDDVQVREELKLSKYDGSNENSSALDNCGTGITTLYSQMNSGGPVSVYAPNIQGAAFYSDFEVPGFSEFWLHGSLSASPLPVELTSFTTDCIENAGVNLSWTTASEYNSSYFDVLKSEDGFNWRTISTVAAAGFSTSNLHYETLDSEKTAGIAYYKLLQYDMDGESKEYGPISIECETINEIMVKTFPNPSGDEFYIEFISGEASSAEISIVDAHGKTVHLRMVEIQKGVNLYHFDDLNILPGMYYIQISNDLTTPTVVKHSFR